MPDALAMTILALAIGQLPPGRSPYSFEKVEECGLDRAKPACVLEPSCQQRIAACRPPHWSKARGAWVRLETSTTGTCRYARIAKAIANSARRLKDCRDEDGRALSSCEPAGWPGSTKSLALAMLTVATHESGLREDVQKGIRPTGRGAGGMACLMQVGPRTAPRYASWLTPEQRAKIVEDPQRREQFVATLLGDDAASLERCFRVGGAILVQARKSCSASKVAWDYGMFSRYGTGSTCDNVQVGRSRKRTYGRLVARSEKVDRVPAVLCR